MRGSIRRRGERWEIRWTSIDGRRLSRTYRTRRTAEEHLRQFVDESERGLRPIDTRTHLADFLAEWESATKPSIKPRSWEAYDSHRRLYIEPMLGQQRLALIDDRARQRFVSELGRRGLSPKTIRSVYGTLTLVLKLGAAYGLCRAFDPGSVKLPRVTHPALRIPTPDQVEQLADAIDPRAWALVLVAGYMALRQGELLALHLADIEWLRGRVYVHRSIEKTTRRLADTKSVPGYVTMPTRVQEALAAHIEEHPHATLVFHQGGRPLSASTLTNWWQDARKACDLADVRFHDLRHTAASLMIRAGWSAKRVQLEMRHSEPGFTLRTYGHLFPDELDAGRQALDRLIAETQERRSPEKILGGSA